MFDFASEAGATSVFHLLAEMFNKPLPIEDIILAHTDYLTKERDEYSKGVEKGRVQADDKQCVHLFDCFPCKEGTSALYK